jgi:hypothetical protein
MRRGVGHTPAAAGRTEAAAFARERDDSALPAGVAVHAHEAVREHAAAQERAQLARDEARSRSLARGRVCEEGLELGA